MEVWSGFGVGRDWASNSGLRKLCNGQGQCMDFSRIVKHGSGVTLGLESQRERGGERERERGERSRLHLLILEYISIAKRPPSPSLTLFSKKSKAMSS